MQTFSDNGKRLQYILFYNFTTFYNKIFAQNSAFFIIFNQALKHFHFDQAMDIEQCHERRQKEPGYQRCEV